MRGRIANRLFWFNVIICERMIWNNVFAILYVSIFWRPRPDESERGELVRHDWLLECGLPWPVFNWLREDGRAWWEAYELRDLTLINQIAANTYDSYGWTGRRPITHFRVDWRPRITFRRDDR